MDGLGFVQHHSDPCLFTLHKDGVLVGMIGLYVDDMIIAGLIETIEKVKDGLKSEFEIKDLRPAKYIVGIQVEQLGGEEGIRISQGSYVDEILEMTGMQDCKLRKTPLSKEDPVFLHPDSVPVTVDTSPVNVVRITRSQSGNMAKQTERVTGRPRIGGDIFYPMTCLAQS